MSTLNRIISANYSLQTQPLLGGSNWHLSPDWFAYNSWPKWWIPGPCSVCLICTVHQVQSIIMMLISMDGIESGKHDAGKTHRTHVACQSLSSYKWRRSDWRIHHCSVAGAATGWVLSPASVSTPQLKVFVGSTYTWESLAQDNTWRKLFFLALNNNQQRCVVIIITYRNGHSLER